MRTGFGRSKASVRRDPALKEPDLEPIPPSSESVDYFEMRPGEDFMDYLDRRSELFRREREKTMAVFEAVCRATEEKLKEVVFHCERTNAAVDETMARIQAIRSQDSPQ